MDNLKEYQPDSGTEIISEQTIVSGIAVELCCNRIAEYVRAPERYQGLGEISSQLDELLGKSAGTITTTLGGKELKNTEKRPVLAKVIADKVELYLEKFKLTGKAKRIALDGIAAWLDLQAIAADESQGNQPSAIQEHSTGRELPSELDTEQARVYFTRAVEAGLMNEQYKWLATQVLLACFCREMSIKLGLGKGVNSDNAKRLSWKPFEVLFGIERGKLRLSLNDIQKTGQDPIGIESVTTIFLD